MLARIRDARLIITDSGGIQKESFWFGKPCIVVRNSTEWPGLVESGWNSLVEPGQILRAAQTKTVGNPIENPYGDGKAAEKMVNLLAIVKNHGGN
jgi:UDP-N-acetylglucosamine 2-epimerase